MLKKLFKNEVHSQNENQFPDPYLQYVGNDFNDLPYMPADRKLGH